MSLNNTPSGERIHIGLFGRRNAGKSSIINAITGQNLAIVSESPWNYCRLVRLLLSIPQVWMM